MSVTNFKTENNSFRKLIGHVLTYQVPNFQNIQCLINVGNKPDENKIRLEQIRSTYIGYLDPVSLVTRSKFMLNRNNDGYFQTYLLPLEHLPILGFRPSEHQSGIFKLTQSLAEENSEWTPSRIQARQNQLIILCK